MYGHIPTFLAKENKKYQITKIAKGARNREYIGAVDWLKEAGVVNVCYCLNNVELPLKGNYDAECLKRFLKEKMIFNLILSRIVPPKKPPKSLSMALTLLIIIV